MINVEKFITLCGLTDELQVAGMSFLVRSMEADAAIEDTRWKAYMLATVGRECGGTWQPIEEYGKGAGRHPVLR